MIISVIVLILMTIIKRKGSRCVDNLTPKDRRKNMQNIRSKGTKIEQNICKALWKQGVRYRKNRPDLPGKPDISIKKYKIAVFLDSCFFHGCSEHLKVPKTNTDYWTSKIARNKERDERINKRYLDMGWQVYRFWEHEIKLNQDYVLSTILKAINDKKK